ncbi:hypothetical protein BC828DRAFT_150005 [Blastocladiella britannica]|nr:hypothetical protein BC828DRAFT_150005 [Blastocladiella britannica]
MFRRKLPSLGSGGNQKSPDSPTSPGFPATGDTKSPTSLTGFFLGRRGSNSEKDAKSTRSDATSVQSSDADGKSTSRFSSDSSRGPNMLDLTVTTNANEILMLPTKQSRASIALAICQHDPKFREIVQKKLAKVNKLDNENKKGPLHYAALYGNADELSTLLAVAHASILVDLQDGLQRTALHYLCIASRFDLLDILLRQEKISVEVQDRYGYTPIHYIIANNDWETLQSFLNKDPDLDSTRQGETYLHFAIRLNKSDCACTLIEHPFPNMNATDSSERTALHLACETQLDNVVHRLVEHGADPMRVDQSGKLALDYLTNNESLRDYLTLKTLSAEASRAIVKRSMFDGVPIGPPSFGAGTVAVRESSLQDVRVEQAEAISSGHVSESASIHDDAGHGTNAAQGTSGGFNYADLMDEVSEDATGQSGPSPPDLKPGASYDVLQFESAELSEEHSVVSSSSKAQESAQQTTDDKRPTGSAVSTISSDILSILDDLPSETSLGSRSHLHGDAPPLIPLASAAGPATVVPESIPDIARPSPFSILMSTKLPSFGGKPLRAPDIGIVAAPAAIVHDPTMPAPPSPLFDNGGFSQCVDADASEKSVLDYAQDSFDEDLLSVSDEAVFQEAVEAVPSSIGGVVKPSEAEGASESETAPAVTAAVVQATVSAPVDDDAMQECSSVVIHDDVDVGPPPTTGAQNMAQPTPFADADMSAPAVSINRGLLEGLGLEPPAPAPEMPGTEPLPPPPPLADAAAADDPLWSTKSSLTKDRRVSFSSPIASQHMYTPQDTFVAESDDALPGDQTSATQGVAGATTATTEPVFATTANASALMLFSSPPALPQQQQQRPDVQTADPLSDLASESDMSQTVTSSLGDIEESSIVDESMVEDEIDDDDALMYQFIPPPPLPPVPSSLPLPKSPDQEEFEDEQTAPICATDAVTEASPPLAAPASPSLQTPPPSAAAAALASSPLRVVIDYTPLTPLDEKVETAILPTPATSLAGMDSSLQSTTDAAMLDKIALLERKLQDLQAAPTLAITDTPATPSSPSKLRFELEDHKAQLETEKMRTRRQAEEVERLNGKFKEKNLQLADYESKLQRVKSDLASLQRKTDQASEDFEYQLQQEQSCRRKVERELSELQSKHREETAALRHTLESQRSLLTTKDQKISHLSEQLDGYSVSAATSHATNTAGDVSGASRGAAAPDGSGFTSVAASPAFGLVSVNHDPPSAMTLALDRILDQRQSHTASEEDATLLRRELDDARRIAFERESRQSSDLVMSRHELELARQQNTSLSAAILASEQAEARAKTRAKELESDLETVREQFKQADRQLGAVREELAKLQREHDAVGTDARAQATKLATLSQLQAQLSTLQQERLELTAELGRTKLQMTQQMTLLKSELQAQTSASSASMVADAARFKAEIASLSDQLGTATRDLQRSKARLVELEQEKFELDARCSKLAKQCEQQAAELKEVRSTWVDGEQSKSTTGQLLASVRAEKALAQSLLDEKADLATKLEKKLSQARADEATAQDLLTKAKADLAAAKNELRSQAQAVEAAAATHAQQQTQIAELRQQLAQAQVELSVAERSIQCGKKLLEEAIRELEAAKGQCSALEEASRGMRRAREDAVADLERTSGDLRRTVESASQFEQECTTLKALTQKAQQEQSRLEAIVQQQQSQMSLVSGTRDQLSFECESLQSKLTQLRQSQETALEAITKEREAAVERLKTQIRKLEDEGAGSERARRKLEADMSDSASRLQRVQAELATAKSAHETLLLDNAAQRKRIGDLERQVHVASDELQLEKLAHDALRVEYARTQVRSTAASPMRPTSGAISAAPQRGLSSSENHASEERLRHKLVAQQQQASTTLAAMSQDHQEQLREAAMKAARLEAQVESLTMRLALKVEMAAEAGSREAELKRTIADLRNQLKDAEEAAVAERSRALERLKAMITDLETENLANVATQMRGMLERSARDAIREAHAMPAEPTVGAAAVSAVPSGSGAGGAPVHLHVHSPSSPLPSPRQRPSDRGEMGDDENDSESSAYVRRPPNPRRHNHSYRHRHHKDEDIIDHQRLRERHTAREEASRQSQREVSAKIAYLEEKMRLMVNQPPSATTTRTYVAHRSYAPAAPPPPKAPDHVGAATLRRPSIHDTITRLRDQNMALESKLKIMAYQTDVRHIANSV